MKITYLANFTNTGSDETEKHIKKAFEDLGHEVILFDEKNFDINELLSQKADMFLFHKAGVGKTIQLKDLVAILSHTVAKKVVWYFDKIEGERNNYVEPCAMYSDYVFLTDDTWRRRHKYKNVYSLKQGIGIPGKGKERKEYKCDIAFTGQLYGEREKWVLKLLNLYGDRFRGFNNVFNKDLKDLCASAKIIIAPQYPSEEFYWSSRIYQTLGSGGFLIHPELYGLKDEFEEGKHYAGYRNFKELIKTIEYFLENEEERKQIQEQGYQQCKKVATYKKRIEQMLETIYGSTKTLQRDKPKIKKG